MSGSSVGRQRPARVGAILAVATIAWAAPSVASAATVTVCPHGCDFAEIQPAVNAAHPGDTVRVAAGGYAGGLVIDKNLSVVGAGPSRTVINGGGPVITIGEFLARRQPTVSISGVAVTGGSTHSSPLAGEVAGGAGITIPPGADFRPGATVTISRSLIAHNRAAPTTSEPFGPPCPDARPCPFAAALGGAILNGGNLTLVDSDMSDNHAAGPITSDADGGAIYSLGNGGKLTIQHSTLLHNSASVTDPNGRFAEGGAVFASNGSLVLIQDSRIASNSVSLSSSFPYRISADQTLQLGANSGGVHIGDAGSLTIENTSVDHNQVSVADRLGQPNGIDAGVCDCGSSRMVIRHSQVAHNTVSALVGSTSDIFATAGLSIGGALEADGPAEITDTQVMDNGTSVTSPTGSAIASAAVAIFSTDPERTVIANSKISGNRVLALSAHGLARINGAGVLNAGSVVLQTDTVSGNSAVAHGLTSSATGGGIWNGSYPGGPPVHITLSGTTVSGNAPDQCFGVSC